MAKKEKTKVKSKPKVIKPIARCHSFWHRECVNRDEECHRCSKFY